MDTHCSVQPTVLNSISTVHSAEDDDSDCIKISKDIIFKLGLSYRKTE